MKKNIQVTLVALAAIAGLVAAIVLLQSSNEAPSPVRTEANSASAPALPAPQVFSFPDATQSVQTRPQKAAAPSHAAPSLAKEFESARDYRVLLEGLLQRKAEGRLYYAVNIVMHCSGMRSKLAAFRSQAAASREQETARQLYAARCASFSDDEISSDRGFYLNRDERLKDDPFKTLDNEWSQVHETPEKRQDLIARILETDDPLFLQRFGLSFFAVSGSRDMKLDGHVYTQPNAMNIFSSAWIAAVCEGTGGKCGGPNDQYVMEICAVKNTCTTSRQELFAVETERSYGAEGLKLYKHIYPKLVEAIKNKDVAAFM